MKALVLAGGYAKRLLPLTENMPKPLLPIRGKPIIDYLMEKLVSIDEVKEIILSSNKRFEGHFKKWLNETNYENVKIMAEPTLSEEEKFGTIKAISYLRSEVGEDCLVAAGDNIFTSDLKDFTRYYLGVKAPCIAVYDVGNLNLAREYGVLSLDRDIKVLSFEEKPKEPKSTLIATCLYLLPKRVLDRTEEYLSGGNPRDSPGYFIQWLCKRETVYGYTLEGKWTDIGTLAEYERAKGLEW